MAKGKTKTCTKCGRTLPLTEEFFYRRKSEGKRPAGRGWSACRACIKILRHTPERIKRDRDYQRNRHRERSERGVCKNCGAARLPTHAQFCEKHWFANCASRHFGSSKLGPVLKQLAEAQQWECPFSGEYLYPAVNMSLDHKVALSRGGTNEIANVQWVTKEVNLMKHSMSENRFIVLCHIVSSRFVGPDDGV